MNERLPQNNLPTFRVRPAVSLSGGLLVAGGVSAFFFSGIGIFSISALGLGAMILMSQALLRRSQTPVDAFDQVDSAQEMKFKEIKRTISKAQYLENVGDLGERVASQLGQISERFKKFEKLLPLKFNPDEITFGRYYSGAEQTHLAVIDNLTLAAATLATISTTDPKQLDSQIKSAPPQPELESLLERKSLRDKQIEKIKDLLALNEKAITEFDRFSQALTETQTRKGESNAGLDATMEQLKELAARAKKYSVSP